MTNILEMGRLSTGSSAYEEALPTPFEHCSSALALRMICLRAATLLKVRMIRALDFMSWHLRETPQNFQFTAST